MYNMLRRKGERKEREGKMKEGRRKGKKQKIVCVIKGDEKNNVLP